ncbi:PREDICTED: protein ECERIFERUM 1-like [Camelina sativa]|uniref:Protein ECERIFERUM 1-like n=1 Tax=Camelina sativa TaxID=90675 RepID=A0ABM0UC78_CAMSA|nr:PREDICTED: protein ECERIFERUM 1-like [Camelina sativa]
MEASPVTGVRLSSVVPASVVGENKPRPLTPMDLAMKLHYVRAVYFLKGKRDFTVSDLKTTMFTLLQSYHHVSGRIRMPENDNDPSGLALPYIRCNDSGIRIVEANVEEFTVEKWLDLEDRTIDHRFLVYDHVLGPDLFFSPLVFLQITQFKCGGFSIGLSWTHVLGDVFSASTFMKTLGQLMSGHGLPELVYPKTPELTSHDHNGEAIAIKKIESVGNCWLLANKCNMGRYNFNISLNQLDRLMAKYTTQVDQPLSEIDILYALIWNSLLNIRGETDTNVITICDRKKSTSCWNDDLVISVVERKDERIGISELAALIACGKREENGVIKRMIEEDRGSSDFITYGANLTFVNLDMADMYEFEIKGEKPDFVNYTIHGVGDKGVVLVFPKEKSARIVSVVMPEEDLAKIKDEVTNMIM